MTTELVAIQELSAIDAIHRRHSVRSYMPDTVDEPTIRWLLDAAVHAPTAMHREPWSFVVIQDRELMKRISDRAKTMAIAEVTAHSELLRAPGATPSSRLPAHLSDSSFNIFYDAGTLIVICGKQIDSFVTADCWLAAENLMVGASAIGLGTCCIGFALPALHTPEIKRELGIPDDTDAVAAIILGIPQGQAQVVPRKPPQILRWFKPFGRTTAM